MEAQVVSVNSRSAIARQAGVLYFVFMILGIVGQFAVPTVVVPGDAAATARKLAAGMLLYRLDLLLAIATHVLFLVLVVKLHALFRDTDREQALLMLVLVVVGVAVAFANLLLQFVPLLLLGGSEYLAAFTRPQLEAMALNALRLHRSGATVVTAFWGLWLFPFGILVMRSRMFPRVLGVLLMVAGAAYIATSVVGILRPELRQLIFRWMIPLYMGEVPIIFWLLLKGAGEVIQKVR